MGGAPSMCALEPITGAIPGRETQLALKEHKINRCLPGKRTRLGAAWVGG